MRINIPFTGLIAAFFVCLPAYAQAQELKLAPLNPEFEKMINNNRRGILRNASRTPDGHGLGLRPSPLDLSHIMGRSSTGARTMRAVPASYDLRTLGRLTPVKDQGEYGTCWAFASYGSLESCLLLSPGETWDFSENNLVNLAGFDYGFDGGGNGDMSTAYLARWTGPIKDTDDPYPYPGQSTTNPPVKHVQAVEIIGGRTSSLGNDEIKQVVQDHGALYVSMYWINSSYNSATYSFYDSSILPAGNHAVAIVGWDDAYSSNNFSTPPPGDGAFIVRNSWGTGWGQNGYFYVSYYDGTLARNANYLFLNAESTNNYSHIYQYDPLGWVTSLGYGTNSAWGANIFTVTNSGDLSAVSFYAVSPNISYEIRIYSDISANLPSSGTLCLTQTGSLTNAGYYTISLSSPIFLNAGTLFSVVVKITAPPSYSYVLPVEYAVAGYSSHATASPGQSFIKSESSEWKDITTFHSPTVDFSTMNLCIKAFAVYTYPPPANLSASAATYSDRVRLTWSASAGATGYSIYRGMSRHVLSASFLASTSALCYDDMSVNAGFVYHYWVKATGVYRSSAFSTMASGSSKVLTPTSLSASQGTSADGVQLTWTASSGTPGCIIYRNHVNNTNTASEIGRCFFHSYTDISASPGNIFYYWVKSYTSIATSLFSSVASGYRGLPPPDGVSASEGTLSSGVRVAWNGSTGAVSYCVWRGITDSLSAAVNIGETGDIFLLDTSATPGVVYYYWVQPKRWSVVGAYSASATGWRLSMAAGNNTRGDLDGDGLMDFAVYQESTGIWYARLSGSGWEPVPYQLGCSGFTPVPCDYDGDGHTDPAVYQPATGRLIALLSSRNNELAYGAINADSTYTPVIGDYDGDGRADAMIYQEATGIWKGLLSKYNYQFVSTIFGGAGCKPASADYDGDGIFDIAYYLEQSHQDLGYWYLALSGSGYQATYKTTSGTGVLPVPADYDGDHKADIATYNPVSGVWNYWSSAYNYPFPVSFALGGAGCAAVPGDYDGDGKADIVVYNETSGLWSFLFSSLNYLLVSAELGGPGFKPAGAMH